MTVMMMLPTQGSPKHRYDMTEVDYGGGGHRIRLKDQLINLCVYGVPLATYIKDGGRRRPALIGRAQSVESY